MSDYAAFRTACEAIAPRTAVVLGSGLGGVVGRLTVAAEVAFADVPGFAAPTVHGHGGRVLVGTWAGAPVLLFQGRMHRYEGHPWVRVVAPIRLAADLGVRRLLLTNAAGGIHPELNPGDLMAIRGHWKLLSPSAWRTTDFVDVYSPRLVAATGLFAGVYAALTGPCYETPAEIRGLKALGADAVGMSTAVEAETAHAAGLEVAGISCITNKAAGLSVGTLDHSDVQQVAGRVDVVDRMANTLERLVVLIS